MINPQELRIGNLVNHNGIQVVHSIDGLGVNILTNPLSRTPFGEIQRIPLTKDILLKLGFQEMPESLDTRDKVEISVSTFHKRYLRVTRAGSWFSMVLENNDINTAAGAGEQDCVHQIQNLYFALSGKELKYQP